MKRTSLVKVHTPLGVFSLYASDRGLVRVFLPGTPHREIRLDPRLYIVSKEERCISIAKSAAVQLLEYSQKTRQDFDIKIDITLLSPFQKDIYRAARTIPYGQTTSYANLSSSAGHLGKARATGGALGRNPLPIIVPCHRIVSKSGRIGGWSGPIGLKESLLEHEQSDQ